MQCPKCGNASLKPGQKFCTKCGYRFPETNEAKSVDTPSLPVCPKCGKPAIKLGQKFCPACGTSFGESSAEEKGLLRDAANFVRGAVSGGQEAVREGHRQRDEERLREEANRLGYEVNKPDDNGNNQQSGQPSRLRWPRPTVDTHSVEGVSLVNGRAIWNIEKGQIARLITESELAHADNLKGVIVQEGCNALVYIDGTLVANMEAGVYTFPAKSEADLQEDRILREIESEQEEYDKQQAALEAEQRRRDAEWARTFRARGVFGELAAFGRGVMGFLFGHKKGDDPELHRRKNELKAKKISTILSPKACRVYIISNRAINLVFNSQENASGTVDFVPIKVKTRLVDIDVAVTMQLQIINIHQFVTNYLADQKSVSTLWLQRLLSPMVQQTLGQMLRNYDYQEEGLSENVVLNLKNRLRQILNEFMKGIEVTRVFEITDNSADFERFRAVERELYASEKELGFLQRTNEFRNRLEQEQNRQVINHATNEESLRQALQDINKDKLLSVDEMDQFVIMLRAQKRLRDSKDFIDAAKVKEEEYEAISDLKKCRLLKDDDVAALENTLSQGQIGRENVTEIMRVQALQKIAMAVQIAQFELSDNQMEHNMATELRKAQHQGNLVAAQIDTKRLIDIYNDERNEFDWNRAFDRLQQKADYAFKLEERQWQSQFGHQQQETDLEWQQRQREHDLGRQDKYDDIDILAKKAAIASENMAKMKEAELLELKEKNRSVETIHGMDVEIELNRDNNFATMSADAIRAAQLSHLTGEAQVAMANAYSKDEANELLKKQAEDAERREREQREAVAKDKAELMDFAKEMAGMVKDTATSISGSQQAVQQQRYEDQRERADEYRENAMHQQNRMDQAMDQSLNYTTRAHQTDSQSFAEAMGGTPRGFKPLKTEKRFCSACGAPIEDDETFCPECGQKVD